MCQPLPCAGQKDGRTSPCSEIPWLSEDEQGQEQLPLAGLCSTLPCWRPAPASAGHQHFPWPQRENESAKHH